METQISVDFGLTVGRLGYRSIFGLTAGDVPRKEAPPTVDGIPGTRISDPRRAPQGSRGAKPEPPARHHTRRTSAAQAPHAPHAPHRGAGPRRSFIAHIEEALSRPAAIREGIPVTRAARAHLGGGGGGGGGRCLTSMSSIWSGGCAPFPPPPPPQQHSGARVYGCWCVCGDGSYRAVLSGRP